MILFCYASLMHDQRYLKFIELFNAGEFFEAHEVLEDLWRETEGEVRDFYQGLIQIAAVFVHIKNHNRYGALNLFQKANLNLSRHLPSCHGLDIRRLLKETGDCLAGKRGQLSELILQSTD